MSLYLPHLIPQVEKMAEELTAERARYQRVADRARELLKRYSISAFEFRTKAKELGAAVPSNEPIDLQEPPKPVPSSFFAIAADGSQVQPDRHGIALYYLINIGSIVLRESSGETPIPRSMPFLFYRDEDLYEGNRLVQGSLLDVRRGLAELKEISERVKEVVEKARREETPILALIDGTLLLWILEEEKNLHQDKIRAYTEEMDKIRNAGALLAGFISRPRYCEVVDLLRLMHFGEETLKQPTLRRPWGRLTDATLFSFLPKGWRSALFESPSVLNDYYGENRVFFFYLNVEGEIARVEVPEWIARDRELVAFIQGAILKQSENTGGYPYVLERAHELAVIKAQERKSLEEMIERAMMRKGLIPQLSPKERWKRLM
ncbi:MAG: DNA double-strand break repair nuclease NurA [Anaerolineae bacterium]|nr:DNA double-strand break repair nuclease NurA [Anaerolineae bacterium]MDW8102092.1 DNA double-strand break repair nuclease NurA [Anaerolineae bacterium]